MATIIIIPATRPIPVKKHDRKNGLTVLYIQLQNGRNRILVFFDDLYVIGYFFLFFLFNNFFVSLFVFVFVSIKKLQTFICLLYINISKNSPFSQFSPYLKCLQLQTKPPFLVWHSPSNLQGSFLQGFSEAKDCNYYAARYFFTKKKN